MLDTQSVDVVTRLDFRNVTVRYGSRTVLHDISFQIPHGARLAVVGPNGAGKSTLFKALVGLLPIDSGEILIHSQPIGSHVDCVAYIPQREEVDWKFPVTVRDVVTMGRYGKLGWLRQPDSVDKRIIQQSIADLGITVLADRSIQELSGGQQQRVFLARAIAQEPHILLMDEPFNGVDVATQETTLRLLDDMRDKSVTVMVSTHDLNLAREKFDLVLMINQSMIALGPPAEVFTSENIQKTFHSQVLLLDGVAIVDQCCGGDDHDHIHEPGKEER